MAPSRRGAAIDTVKAGAYRIPTDAPEGDGTLTWEATTLVVALVGAGERTGLGYTYSGAGAVAVIAETLAPTIEGRDADDIPGAWDAMQRSVRNLGRSGVAACAISALDCALWDLKAKRLDLPLALLLGRRREQVPIYGSGGFTTYADQRLREQLGGWANDDGCRWVKMKIGADPRRDPARVAAARAAIGGATLFVDANGAFSVRQALAFAETCRGAGIGWFEEPVTSDDLAGLRLVREGAPPGVDIAAGEYGFTLDDARRMLEVGAVDVLQADVTRCGGISGFLAMAALCEAHHIDLSGHCAPALHLHPACAANRLRHLEWFHDHVRIEGMLFDGAPVPRDGEIAPDLDRPGHGLTFKAADAESCRIAGDFQ
ncbi:MAG TPA: enolase C-terminal domain-like protein [Caulobacteraceae bacterium]|nr:enolase C-terminal domain-like protein [Caulobacteraceae bacterium]